MSERTEMVWTRFMDMNSGGGRKEDFSKCYIEAPEAEAKVIFYNRFGHNPERVTCTCCGEDYSIGESPTLAEATAFDRGCSFENVEGEEGGGHYVEKPSSRSWASAYVPLDDYVAAGVDVNSPFMRDGQREKVAFIFAADIKPEERHGSVPSQGYVWID